MPESSRFRIRCDAPQADQLRRLAETLGISEATALARCLEHGLRAMSRAVDKLSAKRRR